MSKCETCANFVYQAMTSQTQSSGIVFKGTPLEREGRAISYPICGCIHSGKEWQRLSWGIRKPNNMPCDYRKKELK